MLNILSIVTSNDPYYWLDAMMYEPAFKAYRFIGTAIFWLVGHILLSIAVYYMTKKQGYKKLWLSFIPFFNLIPLGKLLGKTVVWRIKINNLGLWTAITGIISAVFTFILGFGDYVEIFEYLLKVTVTFENQFVTAWAELTTTTLEEIEATSVVTAVYTILAAVDTVSLIPKLLYIFFYVSLVFLAFRLYNPQRAFLYAILSVFIEPLFGIFLFVSRNNPRYIVIRREPPQGGYYGGYYNGPQNFNGQSQNKQPENPFPEFGESEDKSTDTGDDFFN